MHPPWLLLEDRRSCNIREARLVIVFQSLAQTVRKLQIRDDATFARRTM